MNLISTNLQSSLHWTGLLSLGGQKYEACPAFSDALVKDEGRELEDDKLARFMEEFLSRPLDAGSDQSLVEGDVLISWLLLKLQKKVQLFVKVIEEA